MVSMTAGSMRRNICTTTLLAVIVAHMGAVAAQSKVPATRDAVVSVSGMVCEDMCAPTLQTRLAKLPNVKSVTVSAEKGRAVITFSVPTEVTNQVIERAVADAGFTATKIAWQKPRR